MNKNTACKLAGGLFGAVGLALAGKVAYRRLNRTGKKPKPETEVSKPIYDSNGFDQEGYDRDGFNAEGLDRRGFNRQGYDAAGFNRYGYDRDRYDREGLDRAGHPWQFYVDHWGRLYIRLYEARNQLDAGKYRYAIHDARLVLEEALRAVVAHLKGPGAVGDSMLNNLQICEGNKTLCLDEDFIHRLHHVRKICNGTGHEIDYSDGLTHERVYFAISQVRDFLKQTESLLIPSTRNPARVQEG